MSKLQPLDNSKLKPFQFFFKAVHESMGFVPNSLKTMARVPGIMGAFSILSGSLLGDPKNANPIIFLKLFFKQLGWTSRLMNDPNRIPLSLRHMVSYVTSRAAGCIYCQAHTFASALQGEVDENKMKNIWTFEDSDLFSESEKSALRFGIAAGSAPNAVTEEHFTDLREHFNENQIVELGAVISLFGFLNRWNDTFATQLESEPIATANSFLKDEGWLIGKHA